MEVGKKLKDQSLEAAAVYGLANIEYSKGNYDEATKPYNEVKATFEKLGDQSGIATTLGQLGRLAENRGDLEAAERRYQQALEIFQKLGEKPYIHLAKEDLERVWKLKQKKP